MIDLLLQAGLVLSLLCAAAQVVKMALAVIIPGLSWYRGGSIAYFAAPVAFALTGRLLDERRTRGAAHG